VSNATEKLSSTVRSLASEVRDLGQGKGDANGTVAGLAQQLADKGEQLADYVSAQGPSGLVQELRSFASRKPGTFLLGALTAGVLTGRLVKGATASSSTSGTSSTDSSGTYGTAGVGGSYTAVGTSPAPYDTDPALAPVATVPPIAAEPTTYLDDIPVAHSDDSGILDRGVDSGVGTIGPVSGDDRLRAEGLETTPFEQSTGSGAFDTGTERR
jgi:hypothetical protein